MGTSEAQIEEIADERKDKVFIENVVDKCNVYNNYSKFHPPVVHTCLRALVERLSYTFKDARYFTHT